MNLALDWNGREADIRATGYLSRRAGSNLAVILADLGRMEIQEIRLDLSGCSPVCVGAVEILLQVKFDLAVAGVSVRFSQSPPSVSRVFEIMGLQLNGEPLVASRQS